MISFFHSNISGIKKLAGAAMLLFILSISSVIIFNTVKINGDENLSLSNNALKHLIEVHNVNDNNFSFIKINFNPVYYYDTGAAVDMNIAAAISLFLIPLMMMLYVFPAKKYFFSENILFATGFKNSLFIPPKYSH